MPVLGCCTRRLFPRGGPALASTAAVPSRARGSAARVAPDSGAGRLGAGPGQGAAVARGTGERVTGRGVAREPNAA